MLRTSLVASLLTLAVGVSQAADEKPAVLGLTVIRSVPQLEPESKDYGVLFWQLPRQAVLIAARDELGISTRDSELNEQVQIDDPNDRSLIYQPTLITKEGAKTRLLRKKSDGWETIWERSVTLNTEDRIVDLTAKLAELTKSEMPQVLKQAGFADRGLDRKEKAQVPAKIDALLAEPTVTAQFAAVRLLHDSLKGHLDSPAVVSRLVRGYANLGVLTESFWGFEHKSFKARALLYAERLVQAAKSESWALEHRAYARALVGLHGAALVDLTAAAKSPAPLPADVETASWRPVIEAYCRFDLTALDKLGEPDEGAVTALAQLLRVLAADTSSDIQEILKATDKLLALTPDCYRAVEVRWSHGPLGVKREAAYYGLTVDQQTFLPRLAAVPGLPETARKTIADYQQAAQLGALGRLIVKPPDELTTRHKVFEQLQTAGRDGVDLGEPSWQSLRFLMQEASFLHAMRLVELMHSVFSSPADQAIEQLKPIVAGHRWEKILEGMADEPSEAQPALEKISQMIGSTSAQPVMRELINRLNKYQPKVGRAFFERTSYNADETCGDLIYQIRIASKTGVKPLVTALRRVSPHLPEGMTLAVIHDWESLKGQAADIEARFNNDASVQAALGKSYSSSGDDAAAERCLKKAVELLPNLANCTILADYYEKKQDFKAWQATLEKALETPSYGLEHAQIQARIAKHFMNNREWATARPYAEKAAESYSGWGLLAAAHCAEGLQDWEAAEQWYRAASERYSAGGLEWYYFCRRTGKGDMQAAHRLALALIQRLQQTSAEPNVYRGLFYLVVHDYEQALAIFTALFQKTNDPLDGLFVVVTAEAIKKTEQRDAALKQIREQGGKFLRPQDQMPRQPIIDLAAMFEEDLAKGKGELDRDNVRAILVAAKFEQLPLLYTLGAYYALRGQSAAAQEIWGMVVGATDLGNGYRTLCLLGLVEQGVTPESYKEKIQTPIKPADPK